MKTSPENLYRKAMEHIASAHHLEAAARFNPYANATLSKMLDKAVCNPDVSDAHREELENARRLLADGRIYCGLWPDDSVNASAAVFANGFLIRVHWGLYRAAIALSYIIAAMVDRGGGPDGARLSPEEGTRYYDRLAGEIAVGGAITVGDLPLNNWQQRTAEGLSRMTMNFVIAHELAHVFLGHLDPSADIQTEIKEPDGDLGEWDPTETIDAMSIEIEADLLASTLVGRLYDESVEDGKYCGHMLFFEIVETVILARYSYLHWAEDSEGLDKFEQLSAYRTHPQPAWRRAVSIASHHPDGWSASLPHSEGLLAIFDTWHEMSPRKYDKELVERLFEFADQASLQDLASLGVQTGDRFTFIPLEAVASFFEQELNLVRPVLAQFALQYIWHTFEQSRAISGARALIFACSYDAFLSSHIAIDEVEPEARDFFDLIQAAVPDLSAVRRFVEKMATLVRDPDSGERMLVLWDHRVKV
ncbi:hypothetical protein [Nocardia sp. MW-W600-9]